MNTNLNSNRKPRTHRVAAFTLALAAAAWATCFAAFSVAADETPCPKPAASTNEVAKPEPPKLTESQQKAVEFTKRYEAARTVESKHEAWRGVRAVQLMVRLLDPAVRSALDKDRVVQAVTDKLATGGVRIVERSDAPYLVLSADAVGSGGVYGYNVKLELIEETVLERPGTFLKTMVTTWDNSQFGVASHAALGAQLSGSIMRTLERLAEGLRAAH